MDPVLIIQIANFYKSQAWMGCIRIVVDENFLRINYKVVYSDHSYLLIGPDVCNNKSVWIAYHDMHGNRLECKAVLFQ